MKDIDFINLVFRKKLNIAIAKKDVKAIIATIKRDVDFLKDQNLMDYSLLLGIEIVNSSVADVDIDKFD